MICFQLNVCIQECKNLSSEAKETEKDIEIFRNDKFKIDEVFNDMKNKLNSLEEEFNSHAEKIDKLKKKKSEREKLKKEFEVELNKHDKEIKSKLDIALQLSTRIDTDRSIQEISRQLKMLQERLDKEERLQGDLTEAAKTFQSKKQHMLRVEHDVRFHQDLVKKITEALKLRQKRYKLFLNFNEIFIKTCFKDSLKHRNLDGKIDIDFRNCTLTIKIKKKSTEGSELDYQDLAMMSGGERSFATVCFILALWEVIESPFRILDEFDVFMDCVARKQSMELMIKSAKKYAQYVFLTPLDVIIQNDEIHRFIMEAPRKNNNS